MRKRFTIEDVAKLAGVSKVTVSYVLNGRGPEARISRETSERVQAAVKELDYRPNAVARSLSSKRASAITLVFQHGEYFSAGSSFINEVLRGVCEACIQVDVNLTLHTRTFENAIDEAHALMDGRTDGALILRDEGDPLVAELTKRGFPLMLFFTRHSNPKVDFVDADNFSGGKMAAAHLLQLGHKNIAVAVGPSGSVASNDRLAGFRSAFNDAGLELRPEMILVLTSPLAVDSLFVNWIQETGASALLCWSDDVAFSCMAALKNAGLHLPTDLSVVGFDSSETCEHSHPTLTSVRQPIYEMSLDATRRLLAKTSVAKNVIDVAERPSIYPLSLDTRQSSIAYVSTSSKKRIL